ncbi:hypothetical protein KQX54_019888 [Cotesia glomerata]|uniref:Maturase K n=1 Tax=Cotesia glomerata TaxID=32391 RepID=A0AAV7J377_COTGL|nr:hypothetical protein KQX54_019888 [Cotesia glomerata]
MSSSGAVSRKTRQEVVSNVSSFRLYLTYSKVYRQLCKKHPFYWYAVLQNPRSFVSQDLVMPLAPNNLVIVFLLYHLNLRVQLKNLGLFIATVDRSIVIRLGEIEGVVIDSSCIQFRDYESSFGAVVAILFQVDDFRGRSNRAVLPDYPLLGHQPFNAIHQPLNDRSSCEHVYVYTRTRILEWYIISEQYVFDDLPEEKYQFPLRLNSIKRIITWVARPICPG